MQLGGFYMKEPAKLHKVQQIFPYSAVGRIWNRPELKIADVKEITASGEGSGTDGGTMPGMMMG